MDTLQFSVDGEFLTEMARDLFVEDTPHKAVTFLTDSLIGMSDELAIKIVLGKSKLTGTNDVMLADDNVSDKYGIPLTFESAWNRLSKKYLEEISYLQMLKKRINVIGRMKDVTGQRYRTVGIKNRQTSQTFHFKTDREEYIKRREKMEAVLKEMLFAGSNIGKSLLDLPLEKLEIWPDYYPVPHDPDVIHLEFDVLMKIDVQELITLVDAETSFSIKNPYKDLIGASSINCENKTLEEVVDFSNRVKMVELRAKSMGAPTVEEYIEAQRKIDDKLSKKIEPNPIEDINDAGWLAPNGDWYGLNGTVGNMLHNQIASALLEAGIIPEHREENPDLWLAETGWARVHGVNVTFEGYQQFRLCGKRIKMTEIQQAKLAKYAKLRYTKHNTAHLALGTGGFCRVQKHLVSGVRFEYLSDEQLEELFD